MCLHVRQRAPLLNPALPAAWHTYQFAEVQTRSSNYSQTSQVTATPVTFSSLNISKHQKDQPTLKIS
ncbi:hypothetical protein WJX82_002542 [Trebouxia sp. C0006]